MSISSERAHDLLGRLAMTLVEIIITLSAILATAIFFVFLPLFVIEARSARAPHRVRCPENQLAADVRLDGNRAVRLLLFPGRQRVTECSRWPERGDCDRACELGLAPS